MNAYSPDNHKWRVLGVIIFVYVFLCFLLAIPAEALRLRTNWAKRVDLSEKIIRGEVVSVKSYWNPERTRIYTNVTLLVDDHIKGDGSGETTITVPGGTVGDDTHWVSDTPQFNVGDYGVILLEPSGYVTGGPDGVYLIQRPIGGTNQLQSLTEDRFLLWIKAYVNGQTRISFEETIIEEHPSKYLQQNMLHGTALGETTCIATVSSDCWKGEYFNNKTLSGSPSMVRDDGASFIDFDWGTGSPSSTCGIGADNFSVRWTRTFSFDADTYRFTVTGDDGFRLYVDDVLKLEKWFDQPPTTYTLDVPLTAGSHTIKMEYYENGGGAVAKLSWQEVSTPTITGVNPSTISAGTGNVLTITGSGFGSSRRSGDYPTIAFRYKNSNYMFNNSKIISWSDTQIQVEVFTNVIAGYPYSPGSWSDTVALINSSGIMDSFYALAVPFGYGRAKWTTTCVPYYINTTGGPSEPESALQAAADTWNGAGANFSFNYGGPTSSGWGLDGQNVLSFADLGSSSIIAQATTYYTGGIVSESDIQFNTGFTWSTDTPTPGDKMDFQSIAVHELGHWLRLLDLYGTNDTEKVMYGFASYGAMKRDLTSDDQAGIQWIYTPTCIATVSSDRWKGEYFNNKTLGGSPSMVRDDGAGSLNFDWGLGSPSTSCAIGVDNFSVRWTRTVSFNADAYRFTVTSDDGFRLYVDDVLKLEKWFDQPPTTYSVDVPLTAGNHTLKMEYYEHGGGATAKLSWEVVSTSTCTVTVSPDRWKGKYFNNISLTGTASMVRDDGAGFIDFDWGTGSPSSTCGIGADNFSVRWTRTFSFDADTYRFTVTGDDGFRLYVDDVLKLEKWFDQPPTTYSVDVPLTAGNHTLKMEYYEHGGGAAAKLSWQPT